MLSSDRASWRREFCRSHFRFPGQRAPAAVGPVTSGFTLIELLVVIAIIAILAALLLPALATVKSARSETDRSMVLCAIALKRYSLRHSKPAPDLNALVPEFLPSVPTDYMDGKPLKYRLNADGAWLLYSVGNDGRDDGGDPSPAKPDQTYPLIWRGKDVVWPSPAKPEEIEAWRKESAKN